MQDHLDGRCQYHNALVLQPGSETNEQGTHSNHLQWADRQGSWPSSSLRHSDAAWIDTVMLPACDACIGLHLWPEHAQQAKHLQAAQTVPRVVQLLMVCKCLYRHLQACASGSARALRLQAKPEQQHP